MLDVFDHNPTPVLLLSRDGVVARVNGAATRIGFSVGEDLSQSRGDLAALIDASRHMEPGEQASARLEVDAGSVSLDHAVIVVRDVADDEPELLLFLREQSREEIAGRLLRRMIAHTPGAGQTYFEQLAVHLSSKLGTRWAMVGSLSADGESMRTVAYVDNGQIVPNTTYELINTPCLDAVQDGPTFFPARAAALYPDDAHLSDNGVEAYVGMPLHGRDGEPVGLLTLMHDEPLDGSTNPAGFLGLFAGRTATEIVRLRAEQEVSRQRALVEQLLDRVGALVLLLEPDGTVVRANRTVERVTGWAEADLVGQLFWDTVAKGSSSDTLQRQLAGDCPALEEDWLTPNASTRRIRWEAQEVPDPVSSETYVLVTGVDLTALESTRRERDRLQERLRQARRLEALGRLAGGVAHDFNNLLLAILGYADLIEMEADPETELGGFAREIRRAGDQAAALTRQLLAFGRRQRLERRELDLHEVVDGAAHILRPLLPADVELHLDLPDVALPVVADPGRLETVVVNLGMNARDAMPEGGRISIAARVLTPAELPDDTDLLYAVSIEVSDTGTGIPHDVLPHIFDPFFTTKELGRGTGLGLASVYGTVQQHGGTVEVRTAAGEGTTFQILLPLERSATEPVSQDARNTPATPIRSRILVAEDDPQVRGLVTRVLTGAGYEVDAHEDGASALEAFDRPDNDYDLVLADVLMPRLGGVELCQKLLERAPDTRIVLTSGFVAEADLVPEGVRLVQKPYLPDDLLREIAQAMG